MKTTQILYLLIFVGIIIYIVASSYLLDDQEGFESPLPVNSQSEPVIAKGIEPTRTDIQAMPNSSTPGTLPFGPYGQMASVGSYPYQDPALLPAELEQMKRLSEDIRAFLVFEGSSVSSSSDPTVQLPLTQLRADNSKLDQEISVLKNNPGIQSSLTQQNLADIQGALTFLQRKIRLFQTSGVISGGVEGFEDSGKTRAKLDDLQLLQTKIYAAITSLSASGTTDPVIQARIKRLQDMYIAVSEMINKLNDGIWQATDVPVYKEDISSVLPALLDTSKQINDILSKPSIASTAQNTLMNLIGKDMVKYTNKLNLNSNMKMDQPFDTSMPGAEQTNSKVGGLDWKKRATSICEQVRLRGLDPQDFGCITKDSIMSPAYSWRGYAKMVCGRLGSTMDPNLPVVCGCPPQEWKGWALF